MLLGLLMLGVGMNYVVRFKSVSEEADSLAGSCSAFPPRTEWAESKEKNNKGKFYLPPGNKLSRSGETYLGK